jgi:hypothetical protein
LLPALIMRARNVSNALATFLEIDARLRRFIVLEGKCSCVLKTQEITLPAGAFSARVLKSE